jgi:hypothetical protein
MTLIMLEAKRCDMLAHSILDGRSQLPRPFASSKCGGFSMRCLARTFLWPEKLPDSLEARVEFGLCEQRALEREPGESVYFFPIFLHTTWDVVG